MQTIAGPNTNALRSITGYNTGSPLRKNKVQLTDQQAGSAAAGAASLATDVSAIAGDQIPAQSAKGEGARILGETAKYAGMGMAFGPIGAGVGALVGLTVGLIKNKKAKDAYKDQLAENKKIENASKAQAALSANVNSQNQDTMPYKSNITKKMSPIPYGSSIKMSDKEYEASKLMMQVSGASELQKEHTFDYTQSKKDIKKKYKSDKKTEGEVTQSNMVNFVQNRMGPIAAGFASRSGAMPQVNK